MKTAMTLFFAIFLSLSAFASSQEIVLKFQPVLSEEAQIEAFMEAHKRNEAARIVFEFNSPLTSRVSRYANTREEILKKSYPNGDFYYLIAGLGNDWSKSDYERFYSVAKWLSLRGFRTILNVIALEVDLQEAVSNPNTTAIVWNSHGATSGAILDSRNLVISSDTFTKLRTSNLKYVLFANCYGYASRKYYGLKDVDEVLSLGWDRTVTSDDLYTYLFSSDFDNHLNKAFGKVINQVPKEKEKL